MPKKSDKKINPKRSINSQRAASAVAEKVRKGELVILKKILTDLGYSPSVAKKPDKVTRTKTFRESISPVVEKMEKHRDKILAELDKKDLKRERHRDLVDSLDKLVKNTQLLSGKETERAGVQINLVNYDPNNNSS